MALSAKKAGKVGRALDKADRTVGLAKVDKALKLNRVWIPKGLDKAVTKLPWKGFFFAAIGPIPGTRIKRWRAKRPIFPNVRSIGK